MVLTPEQSEVADALVRWLSYLDRHMDRMREERQRVQESLDRIYSEFGEPAPIKSRNFMKAREMEGDTK